MKQPIESWKDLRVKNIQQLNELEILMTNRNQHVVPHPNGWAVKPAGGSKASSVQATQKEAIDQGRDIARNQGTELFIHGQNGRIRARDSHGNDPFPPKG